MTWQASKQEDTDTSRVIHGLLLERDRSRGQLRQELNRRGIIMTDADLEAAIGQTVEKHGARVIASSKSYSSDRISLSSTPSNSHHPANGRAARPQSAPREAKPAARHKASVEARPAVAEVPKSVGAELPPPQAEAKNGYAPFSTEWGMRGVTEPKLAIDIHGAKMPDFDGVNARVLFELHRRGGIALRSELARDLEISAQRVTEAISSIEYFLGKKGLMAKARMQGIKGPKDKRPSDFKIFFTFN